MTHRYALRFEDGDRRGEIVALTGPTTTFGRKPGNSVQVLDPSISGKHAEVVVDGEGALLRDLGSTNGTRVNGERISERRLKLGDRVMLGSIDLVFVDPTALKAPASENDIGFELEADEPAPARGSPRPSIEATSIVNSLKTPVADSNEAVRSIGAEKLARSGKKSAVAMIGLFVLATGAAAAWWFTSGKASSGTAARERPVSAVPGNLLAEGYSFEGSELPDGWANAATASAPFETSRAASASGRQGLSADLGASADAELTSVAVAAGKTMKLACQLATRGQVDVRAGLRFESSAGSYLPVEAWGAWKSQSASGEGSLELFEFEASAPTCYDRCRAVIAARSSSAAGQALVDDVSIVAGANATMRTVKHDDVEIVLLGEPVQAGLLFKIDHPLLSGMRFAASDGANSTLTADVDPLGMKLAARGSAAKLEFAAETLTAAGGIATTGREGFKTHQAQFERVDVESVLLGAGRELVRLHFDPPVVLRGRPSASSSGACFLLEAVGASSAVVQVSFNDERVSAEALARSAREAQRAGDPAAVIALWSRLINEHPIDAAMIAEAEAERAKALSAGLAEVATVRGDVERARFFRLLALFKECRAKSLKIAKSYAGTEAEAGARALAESVEKDIELLMRDLDKLEARRLAEIHAALTATKQTRLAERVAEELKSHFKVSDPASLTAPSKVTEQ